MTRQRFDTLWTEGYKNSVHCVVCGRQYLAGSGAGLCSSICTEELIEKYAPDDWKQEHYARKGRKQNA